MKSTKTIKKTVATIAAATMALTTLTATLPVYADTVTAVTTTTAGALANIKYSDTLVPMQSAYYAAQLNTTFTVNGDIACKDGGDITFYLTGYDPDDFVEGQFTKAVVTVKSEGTTATLTLVSDEDLEDEGNYVYYSEELEKLGTTAADDCITINVKDLSETLTTLIRMNGKLTVGTVPTATGMLWDDSTAGWTVNKARVIDSCTITLTAEKETETTPANKTLSAFAETMEAVTMTVGGDVREYTVTDNKLYVAGKYDAAYPAADLTGDALTQKTMLESITAYADFLHYIDVCADNGHTITRDAAGISDYVKNYLVLLAYRESISGNVDNALTDYWYDSYTEDAPTGDDVVAGGLAGAYDTTPGNIIVKDIRDGANANAFKAVRNAATASNGSLNQYIDSLGYPAVVTDSTYGYADASDYTTITTYAQLTTALTNVTNKLGTLGKLANVKTNTLRGIVNTANKATAIAAARPYMLEANTWVNIGAMYCTDSGYPILAQLNTIIGENRGVRLRINVDPDTVTATKPITTTGAFATTIGSAGAARVRVNGLYATNLSAVATYDTTNNCYEFDWDGIVGDSTAVWMLELATYDSVGINSITVKIPDQDAYLAAIGADKADEVEEDTNNTTNDKDSNKGEIDYGENADQASDEIEEAPAETESTKPAESDKADTAGEIENLDDLYNSIIDVIINGGAGTATDTNAGTGTDTNAGTVTDNNAGAGTDTDNESAVPNPDTGETGAACVSALFGLSAVIGAVYRRLRK